MSTNPSVDPATGGCRRSAASTRPWCASSSGGCCATAARSSSPWSSRPRCSSSSARATTPRERRRRQRLGVRHGLDGDVRRCADRRLHRCGRGGRAGARLVAPAAAHAAAPGGLHPGQGVRRPRHGSGGDPRRQRRSARCRASRRCRSTRGSSAGC